MKQFISAILYAILDLFTPQFWGHIVRAVFMTICAMVLIVVSVILLSIFSFSFIPSIDLSQYEYLDKMVMYLSDLQLVAWIYSTAWGLFGSIVFIGMFLFFPVFLTVVIGMYSDSIAESIEKENNYPIGKSANMVSTISSFIRLIFFIVTINLISLPLYIIFTWASPIIYLIVNGYIFGREYFEMVAYRHIDKAVVKHCRKKHIISIIGFGIIFVIVVHIPLINLILPAIMVSMVTHYIGSGKSQSQT